MSTITNKELNLHSPYGKIITVLDEALDHDLITQEQLLHLDAILDLTYISENGKFIMARVGKLPE